MFEPFTTLVYAAVVLTAMLAVIVYGKARHYIAALVLAVAFLLGAFKQAYLPTNWGESQPLFAVIDSIVFAVFFAMGFSVGKSETRDQADVLQQRLSAPGFGVAAKWSLLIAFLHIVMVVVHLTRSALPISNNQYILTLNVLFLASLVTLIVGATPKNWNEMKEQLRIKLIFLFADLIQRFFAALREGGERIASRFNNRHSVRK